jgi:hypothetical protein
MKIKHTQRLMYALDFEENKPFSAASLKRYELLQAIARGEKIENPLSPAAKYLLAKDGDIEAFLGIHPEGYLVFALPMTKESLKQIEDYKALIDAKTSFGVYKTFMRYIEWLSFKKDNN